MYMPASCSAEVILSPPPGKRTPRPAVYNRQWVTAAAVSPSLFHDVDAAAAAATPNMQSLPQSTLPSRSRIMLVVCCPQAYAFSGFSPPFSLQPASALASTFKTS